MRYFISLICSLLLLPLFLSCQKQSFPIAGVDPIKEVSLIEDHSEVLLEWMKRGYRDMILIHVDEHDDLRKISEDKIERLKKLYKNRNWDVISRETDVGARSLYTLADFIYAANRLGIIKRLYWVTPSRLMESGNLENNLRVFLSAFGYSDDTIATFHKEGDAVTGNILGIDVTISSMANLPEIREPVLLTIDIDYFPNSMRKKRAGELTIIRDFFTHMKNRKLQVRHLSMAYSVNGNYTPITDRYIGDELAYIFEHPEITDTWTFPELWHLREKGFTLLRYNHGGEESFNLFSNSLDINEDEPTMLLGMVISLAYMMRHDEALATLEKMIRIKPEYDYSYIYIGRLLGNDGNLKSARPYFTKYLQRNPTSYYGLLGYGDALYYNGRDEEALAMYNKALARGDDLNAVMYAGDSLFQLGRYDEAWDYYNRRYAIVTDPEDNLIRRNFPESFSNIKILEARYSR